MPTSSWRRLSRSRAEIATAETQVDPGRTGGCESRILSEQMTGDPMPRQSRPNLSKSRGHRIAGPGITHPALVEQRRPVEEAVARLHALDRELVPAIHDTGLQLCPGHRRESRRHDRWRVAGIGPNIQNWALGMTVTFPALELPSLRARKAVEQARSSREAR